MTYICLSIIVSLVLISLISIYIARVQRIKMKRYKELYENSIEEMDSVERKISDVLSSIKKIDSSGAFETDDEVGLVFNGIKNILFTYFNYDEENASKQK